MKSEALVATGRCPMCLRDGQNIQDSHYLPKGAYKGFRAPSLKNPNPVVVTGTRMDQTSLQIHDYAFCWDCEQVLNKNGEDWVMPMLAGEAGFPLFDLLKNETPVLSEPDLDTYACAQVAGIDWDKLAHFGMGMFWKGAAHAWPGCAKLELGNYAEDIRKYLRAKAPFPQSVALVVRVVASDEPPWTSRTPFLWQTQPCHLFNFYLRGIDFSLAVGKQIPEYLRHVCFYTNPAHPIMASAEVGTDELKIMKRLVESSKPSRKLVDFFKGPSPRKNRG